MAGTGYLALAALILLLLPAVVLPWEGRRAPDGVYAAIAAGGLIASGLQTGPAAITWAAGAGVTTLFILAAFATSLRYSRGITVLTSGHIKLIAAGSVWLGPVGTLIMTATACSLVIGATLILCRRPVPCRPDLSAIAALAIFAVSAQQTLLG